MKFCCLLFDAIDLLVTPDTVTIGNVSVIRLYSTHVLFLGELLYNYFAADKSSKFSIVLCGRFTDSQGSKSMGRLQD